MSDVALDEIAEAVAAFRHAQAQIKQWELVEKDARARIETALGESEIGTLDDKPVVRWTYVTSSRLDQTLLKGNFPDAFRACQTESTSRRFTVVDS